MILKMKLSLVAGFIIVLLASQVSAAEMPVIKSHRDKVSYGSGVDLARNLQSMGLDVNVDLLIQGLKDELSGKKLLVNERDLRRAMTMFQNEIKKERAQATIIVAQNNASQGEAFLAQNKKKGDVVTLPSGLQYKILKVGDGKKPADGDTVECHYRGTLVDGTEFDNSEAGQPATLKVASVISGWREALKLMPVGSMWQLFIPPQLAYGTQGSGRSIGPNATLIIDVELLAIK